MSPDGTAPRPRSLVVAVNPMPRLYLPALLDELAGHDVTLLAFHREPLWTPDGLAGLRERGVTAHQWAPRGRAAYARDLTQAARVVRRWLRTAPRDGAHALVCQPHHVLTNHLVFAARRRRPNLRVHLVPDGLADHYRVDLGPYRRTMAAKRVVGALVGLPYRAYDGDYLALDSGDYAGCFFLGDPGVLAGRMPCRALTPPELPPPDRQERWLLLGQPAPSPEAAAAVDEVVRALRRTLGPDGDYKPHPAEVVAPERARLLDELGLRTVATTEAAELFAARYGTVAGTASSVLVNLALLGAGTRLVSPLDPPLLARATGRSLAEAEQVATVLRRLGVEASPRGGS